MPGHVPPQGIVITIHEGGWVGVGAHTLRHEDEDVARYNAWGWATLNVDHRAGAGAIHDVIRFYDLARARYPGRPICASGRSSGGHLALLLAVHRPRLACVISKQGPATLLPLLAGRTIPSLHAVVRSVFSGRARRMSPAFRLGKYRGPIVATHSPDDEIVPGTDQLRAMRSMAPNVRLVRVRGVAEAGPGLARWVHVDADAASLARVRRAEIAALKRAARAARSGLGRQLLVRRTVGPPAQGAASQPP